MKSEIKIKFLQELEKFERNYPYLVTVYYHLFKIKDDKSLETDISDIDEIRSGKSTVFGEYGKENWFSIFHKSIRQCDYYDNCYKRSEIEILSKDERMELRKLRHDLANDIISKYEKGENASKFSSFSKEYKRLLQLADLQRREKNDESIGGHLDMILWNTIHLDKDNILYQAMDSFFEKEKEIN